MRTATAARLALGGVCLVKPTAVLTTIGGADGDDVRTAQLVRVLGGRLIAQASADLVWGPRTRPIDIAVDLTHAGSMLAAAWRWPVHRRSALTSAAIAVGTAVLDASPAGRATATPRQAGDGSTAPPGDR